jgi:hypothetical protein
LLSRSFGELIRRYRESKDFGKLTEELLELFPHEHRHMLGHLKALMPAEHRLWFHQFLLAHGISGE